MKLKEGVLVYADDRLRSDCGVPIADRSKTYHGMGIDIITFCKFNLDNFDGFEGAMMLPITKYVWRQKDNRVEDLMKARDFLDVLIEYEKGKYGEILESK